MFYILYQFVAYLLTLPRTYMENKESIKKISHVKVKA
jgi:hypothetical protein